MYLPCNHASHCVCVCGRLHTLHPAAQGLVKQFFNEKEVTSTLVMDALLCGCKQLEAASRGVQPPEAEGSSPMVAVDAERCTFAVNGCLVSALQRAVNEVLPPSGCVWRWCCASVGDDDDGGGLSA